MSRRSLVATVALALAAVSCGGGGTADPSTTASSAVATTESGQTTVAQSGASTSSSAAPTGCPVVDTPPAPFALTDATEQVGLVTPLIGMHGHAAAWGDLDGDGFADLFVGTFADRPAERYAHRGATGPSSDALLLGGTEGFAATDFAPALGRTSGAVFADLDGDGDLDLVAARNASQRRDGVGAEPTAVFRNDGGSLVAVDAGFDASLGGRSIGVLDYDADGLPDLYIVEDQFAGGSSRLYRNTGDLNFEDVTEAAGLPLDVHGLGVAVADLVGGPASEIFVSGSNRLFVAEDGRFREAPGAIPAWETFGNEDIIAGVDVADVNLDGALDLVIGHHYNSTVDFDTEVPIRLYLNESTTDASFRDVTAEAGLIPLPTKAPHVEFADLDNDGNVDILTSASAADGTEPAVFLGQGIEGGIPRYQAPAGLGSDQYWVAAPAADVDRDGRLDILLVEWEPSLPSLFFRGQAEGNWIEVSPNDATRLAGATVQVHESGTTTLLANRVLTASRGYSAGVELAVHVGLGSVDSVDVTILTPDGERIEADGLAANARYRLPGACG